MKRFLIVTLAVVLLAGAASSAWLYRDLHQPEAHSKSGQYIEIPRGSSTASVVRKLSSEGIIKHEWPLKLYLKVTGTGSTLKAGEYDFPSPISPLKLTNHLALFPTEGDRNLASVSLPAHSFQDQSSTEARKRRRIEPPTTQFHKCPHCQRHFVDSRRFE